LLTLPTQGIRTSEIFLFSKGCSDINVGVGKMQMLFQDGKGKILTSEEVNHLSLWEIDERALHVYESEETMSLTGGTGRHFNYRKTEPV